MTTITPAVRSMASDIAVAIIEHLHERSDILCGTDGRRDDYIDETAFTLIREVLCNAVAELTAESDII